MNIVMITTGKRDILAAQSFNSLIKNASDWSKHTITIVVDSDGHPDYNKACSRLATMIVNYTPQGASASRNIGASSIPKYRRQEHVMFIDDDVYMCPRWDENLQHVANFFRHGSVIVSGHAHPFNHTVLRDTPDFITTTVISTVHMFMSWDLWDDVGFFVEPGGPGGSEDVDYCRRATDKKYNLAISKPHCVIHCGLTSSSGKQIVGYKEMVQQNDRLIEHYGLAGEVQFS